MGWTDDQRGTRAHFPVRGARGRGGHRRIQPCRADHGAQPGRRSTRRRTASSPTSSRPIPEAALPASRRWPSCRREGRIGGGGQPPAGGCRPNSRRRTSSRPRSRPRRAVSWAGCSAAERPRHPPPQQSPWNQGQGQPPIRAGNRRCRRRNIRPTCSPACSSAAAVPASWGSALTTAAGVAGGVVAGNALMGLLSGNHGGGFGGGFGGGMPNETTIVNNYGDAAGGFDQGAPPDGGGWDNNVQGDAGWDNGGGGWLRRRWRWRV